MKNKFIFISTLFVFLSFIGIKNTQAATIAISTNTGVVYLTADLEKTTYAPGEKIEADLALALGSASPTSVAASGSANGGSASFDGLGNGITQTRTIGYAQPTPGTYNANFSYSYNQINLTPINAWVHLSTVGSQCHVKITLSEAISQVVSFSASGYWMSGAGLFGFNTGNIYTTISVGGGSATQFSQLFYGTPCAGSGMGVILQTVNPSSSFTLNNGRVFNAINFGFAPGNPPEPGIGGDGSGCVPSEIDPGTGDYPGGPIDFEVVMPC